MRRLVLLLLLMPIARADAQTRLLPMGDLRLGDLALSFEASSRNLFSIDVNQTRAGHLNCAISPSVAVHWTDSTEKAVQRTVAPPRGRERVEYVGPSSAPGSNCDLQVKRVATAKGSTYFFRINEIESTPTAGQVRALFAKLRQAASVTRNMSPDPAVTADSASGGATQPAETGQPFFEFQVEKPVAAVPGNPAPPYPDMLRAAGVQGEVLAQFVVDTSGRVEIGTFKVLKSSHDLFTTSIRQALPNMRFSPAEIAGRKVRQLVQMPFIFSVSK